MGNIQYDIEKFKNIQKLKFTYRYSGRTFDNHKESTADHTWSCFMIADYLLGKLNTICPGKYQLDKLRIFEIIAYHDLLEAETGDVDLSPTDKEKHLTKADIEKKSLPIFLEKIPNELKKIYTDRLTEYEKRESLESKFVKLIDSVEAEFQVFFYKDFYKERNEQYFIQKREKIYDYFPELKFIYYEILEYYKQNKYFCD